MQRVTSAVLLVVAALSAASAGEKEAALFEDQARLEARLVGSTSLGVYFGRKRIGAMTLVIEKAPAESGAAFKQTATMEMTMSGETRKNSMVSFFDARLVMTEAREDETITKGEDVKHTLTTTRRTEGGYSRTVKIGEGEARSCELKVTGDCYTDAGMFMVARAAGGQPGRYTFQSIKWPSDDAIGQEGAEAVLKPTTLEVAEGKAHAHRGREVQASVVLHVKAKDERIRFLVGEKGALLSMSPEGIPVSMQAGSAEEVAQDLPAPKTQEAAAGGATSPMDAVAVYFKVLAGELAIDKLDGVMDWTFVHKEASKENPDVGNIDAASFGELVKTEIKRGIPAITPEQVGLVLAVLKSEVDGDSARVFLPGKDKEFRLAKVGGAWKIQRFPR